jgi:hypothetical protein
MKKPVKYAIIALAIVLFILGIRWGWKLYTKYRHSDLLSFGNSSFKLDEKISITSVIDGLDGTAKIQVKNFSPSRFKIDQLQAELYTKDNTLLAEQKEPLKEAIIIEPNANTTIHLKYQIAPTGIVSLFAESGIIPKGASLAELVAAVGKLTKLEGIVVKLKGFYVSEGFKVDIDELINLEA